MSDNFYKIGEKLHIVAKSAEKEMSKQILVYCQKPRTSGHIVQLFPARASQNVWSILQTLCKEGKLNLAADRYVTAIDERDLTPTMDISAATGKEAREWITKVLVGDLWNQGEALNEASSTEEVQAFGQKIVERIESAKPEITEAFKRSFGDEDAEHEIYKLDDILENLKMPADLEDFNYLWDELYDWGDSNDVWISTVESPEASTSSVEAAGEEEEEFSEEMKELIDETYSDEEVEATYETDQKKNSDDESSRYPEAIDFRNFEGETICFGIGTEEYKLLDQMIALGDTEWDAYVDAMATAGITLQYNVEEDVFCVAVSTIVDDPEREAESKYSLEELREQIAEKVPAVDAEPYAHNIISSFLKMIDEKFGKEEANKAIEDFSLEELGWSKKSYRRDATTDGAQSFISKKIEKLVDEGKSQDQAIAIAYSMAREEGYDVPATTVEGTNIGEEVQPGSSLSDAIELVDKLKDRELTPTEEKELGEFFDEMDRIMDEIEQQSDAPGEVVADADEVFEVGDPVSTPDGEGEIKNVILDGGKEYTVDVNGEEKVFKDEEIKLAMNKEGYDEGSPADIENKYSSEIDDALKQIQEMIDTSEEWDGLISTAEEYDRIFSEIDKLGEEVHSTIAEWIFNTSIVAPETLAYFLAKSETTDPESLFFAIDTYYNIVQELLTNKETIDMQGEKFTADEGEERSEELIDQIQDVDSGGEIPLEEIAERIEAMDIMVNEELSQEGIAGLQKIIDHFLEGTTSDYLGESVQEIGLEKANELYGELEEYVSVMQKSQSILNKYSADKTADGDEMGIDEMGLDEMGLDEEEIVEEEEYDMDEAPEEGDLQDIEDLVNGYTEKWANGELSMFDVYIAAKEYEEDVDDIAKLFFQQVEQYIAEMTKQFGEPEQQITLEDIIVR